MEKYLTDYVYTGCTVNMNKNITEKKGGYRIDSSVYAQNN